MFVVVDVVVAAVAEVGAFVFVLAFAFAVAVADDVVFCDERAGKEEFIDCGLLEVLLLLLSLLTEPFDDESIEVLVISPLTSPSDGDTPSAAALVCRCWTLRTMPAVCALLSASTSLSCWTTLHR